MRRAMARTAAWGPEIPRPEALASHTNSSRRTRLGAPSTFPATGGIADGRFSLPSGWPNEPSSARSDRATRKLRLAERTVFGPIGQSNKEATVGRTSRLRLGRTEHKEATVGQASPLGIDR